MIINVNNEALDFDGNIEIVKSLRLWDEISTVNGDFSYSFELPATTKNKRILGINENSQQNRRINCELLRSGKPVFIGFIRVQSVTETSITCSFFGGNTDWMEILSGECQSYRLKSLDTDITTQNIVDSWTKRNGVVFPFIDRGALTGRKSPYYYEGDFQPFVYVRDAITNILNLEGIKLEGTLIRDSLFNKLITTNNSLSNIKTRIERQTAFIGKSNNQALSDGVESTIQFNDFTGQYYNSPATNWEAAQYRYVFSENVKKFKISYKVKVSRSTGALANSKIRVYLNSVIVDEQTLGLPGGVSSVEREIYSDDFNQVRISGAAAGDTVRVSIIPTVLLGAASFTLLVGSTIKITPTKFYRINAEELLPRKPVKDFLGDIFRMFNCVASYNSFTKTLTAIKLDDIISKPPIDISDQIEVESVNFEEVVSDYSRSNLLLFETQDLPEVVIYNNGKNIPYGGGEIVIDNDFLEKTGDLFELGFLAAFHYTYPFLGSLPRFEYCSAEEGEERDITSITDNGDGYARFNYSGALSATGLLVRISESTVEEYNGDYHVIADTGSYLLLDNGFYISGGTATVAILDIIDEDDEQQAILINEPSMNLSDFANTETIINPTGGTSSSVAFAYFVYPISSSGFGNRPLQCLSFEPQSSRQIGLISYYLNTEKILNRTYKSIAICHLKNEPDLLSPVLIRSNKLNGVFLYNKVTGYTGSHLACEVELIRI